MPKSRPNKRASKNKRNRPHARPVTPREPPITADMLRAALYSSLARAQYCLTLAQHFDQIPHRAGFTGAAMAMTEPIDALLGLQTMIPTWERKGRDLPAAARRSTAERLTKPLQAFLHRAVQPRPGALDPPDPHRHIPSPDEIFDEWSHNPSGTDDIPSMDDIALALHAATIISTASARRTSMVFSAKTLNPHIHETTRQHYQGAAHLYRNGDEQDEFAPNLPDALQYFEQHIDDVDPDFATAIRPSIQLARQAQLRDLIA